MLGHMQIACKSASAQVVTSWWADGDPHATLGPSGLGTWRGRVRATQRKRPSFISSFPQHWACLEPKSVLEKELVALGECGVMSLSPFLATSAVSTSESVVEEERCRVTAAGAIVSRGTLLIGWTPGTALCPRRQ